MHNLKLGDGLVATLLMTTTSCGPGRTTYARFPGGAAAFDRAHADPKALEIADKVVASAGGTHWAAAKQLKWSEKVSNDGKVVLDFDEAWDRWNGRHYGLLHAEQGDVVVMRSLYEGGGTAKANHGHTLLTGADLASALGEAKERWLFDTATLCLPFLLEEPGVKLEYIGELAGETGLDDLKVTFDPIDTTRSGTWHAMVSRDTSQVVRIELVKAGQPETSRIGYKLSDWVEVGGLKLPTKLQNIGLATEVITFKDITVGEPEDNLYVPQVM